MGVLVNGCFILFKKRFIFIPFDDIISYLVKTFFAQVILVFEISNVKIRLQIAFHPPVNIDDPEPSYGAFPLPFSVDDHYASDWPDQLCMKRFRYTFLSHDFLKYSDYQAFKI